MGNFKEQIDELLGRQLDRKQFLQFSLAIFLAAFGVTGLIQALLSSDSRRQAAPKQASGYNSARYNR